MASSNDEKKPSDTPQQAAPGWLTTYGCGFLGTGILATGLLYLFGRTGLAVAVLVGIGITFNRRR